MPTDTTAGLNFLYRMDTDAEGWLYARAGTLNPLWVPSMQSDFEVVATGAFTLTVEGQQYLTEYKGTNHRRDVAFIYNDNTMVIRRIVGYVAAGANETLTLDTGTPTTVNLRTVSFLKFSTLAADALEFAWLTDTRARTAWRFQDLLYSPD